MFFSNHQVFIHGSNKKPSIYKNVKIFSFYIIFIHIWLNGLMHDHHFNCITKLKIKNNEKYHVN